MEINDLEKLKLFMVGVDDFAACELKNTDVYYGKELGSLNLPEISDAASKFIKSEDMIKLKTRYNNCYNYYYFNNTLIHKSTLSKEKIGTLDKKNYYYYLYGCIGDYYLFSNALKEEAKRPFYFNDLFDIYNNIINPLNITDDESIHRLIDDIRSYEKPFYFEVDSDFGKLELAVFDISDLDKVDEDEKSEYKFGAVCGSLVILNKADKRVMDKIKKENKLEETEKEGFSEVSINKVSRDESETIKPINVIIDNVLSPPDIVVFYIMLGLTFSLMFMFILSYFK